MKNCKKCKHMKNSMNINKSYLCDLTNDFIKHSWIKPWICDGYEENNYVVCKTNICCKHCENKCSNYCKETKEEK